MHLTSVADPGPFYETDPGRQKKGQNHGNLSKKTIKNHKNNIFFFQNYFTSKFIAHKKLTLT